MDGTTKKDFAHTCAHLSHGNSDKQELKYKEIKPFPFFVAPGPRWGKVFLDVRLFYKKSLVNQDTQCVS